MAASNVILIVQIGKLLRENLHRHHSFVLLSQYAPEIVPWRWILRRRVDRGLRVCDFSLDNLGLDFEIHEAILDRVYLGVGVPSKHNEPSMVPGTVVTDVCGE